jgi:uncharacterized repeat protein (TIGR01451 family)
MWTSTDNLATPRFDHAATLLPDGRVLISGGFTDTFGSTATMEIFDPAGNGGAGSFSSAGTMASARGQHSTDFLPDGRILIAGGSDTINLPEILRLDSRPAPGARRPSIFHALRDAPLTALASSELFDVGLGFDAAWRPAVSGATDSLDDGEPMVVTGAGFRGVGEASGGNGGQSSPSDHPVVQIRTLENDIVLYLTPDPTEGWSDESFTSQDITGFNEGHFWVTVFTNGIPSESRLGVLDEFTTVTDLAITKTDGETQVEPGDPLTYTIVATNNGPSAVVSAQVTDAFSLVLQGCTWTCVGSGGGVCSPGPTVGAINDSVNLPVGASVTYTAACTVNPIFQGTINNTASILPPAGVTDSLSANNSATDSTLSVCTLLDLSAQTLDGTQSFACTEIRAGDGLEIVSPGDITFDVGERAVLRNGFSVGTGASFKVIETGASVPSAPVDE